MREGSLKKYIICKNDIGDLINMRETYVRVNREGNLIEDCERVAYKFAIWEICTP